jgi:signal transduction histidine kinase
VIKTEALATTTPDVRQETPTASRGVWQWLTRPHHSITDVEQRRQSQLLAGIILSIMVMSGIGTVLLLLRNGMSGVIYGTWCGILLSFGIYLANRRGYYKASAYVFVLQNFVLIHLMSVLTGELAWLFFTSMLMIICAILLPLRATVVMFVASLLTQVALQAVHPLTSNMTNIAAIVVFIITAPLILVFMVHRSRLEAERQAELRNLNENLEKLVDERTRELREARDSAEAARERAEQADRVKSQFLASMSHELRTPLNSMLTFTQLLGMGTFGEVNEEQKSYLDKSLGSGRHLLSLINDVLDVTKIQSGMMRLFIEDDFDPAAEVKEVAEMAATLLEGKPVKLVLDIDTGLPKLTCDKRRVRQVLLNLVSNAVKFTETGSITLSIKKRDDGILFAVIDTGPGIAMQEQTLIFNPFVQTETGIRHGGGTGLGLPISKSLVEAHGGKLWLESAPGEGAAFYALLPFESGLKVGEQEV